MDVKQLRYFVAVAEDLHFTKAADRLHIAQSALSTQIKQLEIHLNARLLTRQKRSTVALTDAGTLFLGEARRALEQFERAEDAGRRAGRGELGHLEIAYVASAAFSGLMPQAIGAFREAYSTVTLRLTEMETPKQLEALATGSIDLAFIRPRPTYSIGVEAKVLKQERLLLAVPEGHPLAHSPEISAISGESFIVPQFDERAGFTEYVADFVSAVRPAPENVYRVRDFLTAISMVASGIGVALVPESIRCLTMDNVVYRPIDGYTRTVGLALAYRRAEISPAANAFVATCLKHSAPQKQ